MLSFSELKRNNLTMDKPVILTNDKGLVNVDLSPAYRAASAGAVNPDQVTRFKKKENISGMARSILKHRIQTLTGKQIKLIEVRIRDWLFLNEAGGSGWICSRKRWVTSLKTRMS